LAAQSLEGLVLVLVDDGSTDGTAEAVRAEFPHTVVLRGNGNLWWAGGLQKGLNWLAAQNLPEDTPVAFTNDDVWFDPEYLTRARAELLSLPSQAFLVAPGIFHPSGRQSDEAGITHWAGYRYGPFGQDPERIDHATTRTLFMRWGDLRLVGGFHPTLLPHYTSDYEFTIRAHRKGIALVPAKTVAARFFDETTGLHHNRSRRFADRWRILFSPRFSFNPWHHFFFIWYAAPWYWKVPCWARVAWSTLKLLR
jgi:GT2 family glycosyltransferase